MFWTETEVRIEIRPYVPNVTCRIDIPIPLNLAYGGTLQGPAVFRLN